MWALQLLARSSLTMRKGDGRAHPFARNQKLNYRHLELTPMLMSVIENHCWDIEKKAKKKKSPDAQKGLGWPAASCTLFSSYTDPKPVCVKGTFCRTYWKKASGHRFLVCIHISMFEHVFAAVSACFASDSEVSADQMNFWTCLKVRACE